MPALSRDHPVHHLLGRWGVIPLSLALVLTVFVVLKLFSGLSPEQATRWMLDRFSLGFILPCGGLIAVLFWSARAMLVARIQGQMHRARFWLVCGHAAASGLSTLALTFTLLGIALGIGTLSQGSLSPDRIQQVISDLTGHFSMAFMTTVVGLPLSVLGQALMNILWHLHDLEEETS